MPSITKRATRVSDGRELIYFDDADTVLGPERAADTRPPAPRPPVPELRQDPLTGEWISIAAARQDRAFLPRDEDDPLAPPSWGNWPRWGWAGPGRELAAARWSASAPGIRDHGPISPCRGRGRWWRPGPTAPPRCPRCPGSSRCTCSRTAARRSASPCTTRTGRSTPTPTSLPGRLTCWPRSGPTGPG